jgi:hypothetical protein
VLIAVSWLGWALRVAIAVAAVVGIYLLGAATLAKFKIGPPAEPDPDDVIAVDQRFRCGVCGAEVVMTAAQADVALEAPRHCREDMIPV